MIGIIIATDEELAALLDYFTISNRKNIYDLEFLEGNLKNKDCVIVKCGIGKVNAARTTQIIIDNYKLNYIINTGVAGGLQDTQIGDIIVANKLVQYDFDITKFNRELGFITGVGKFIESDTELVNKCVKMGARGGTIATADKFLTDIETSRFVEKEFNAIAVDMEGASIAQVCYLAKISFVVIRSISDNPNSNNHLDYEKFIESSSNKIANFISHLIYLIK